MMDADRATKNTRGAVQFSETPWTDLLESATKGHEDVFNFPNYKKGKVDRIIRYLNQFYRVLRDYEMMRRGANGTYGACCLPFVTLLIASDRWLYCVLD